MGRELPQEWCLPRRTVGRPNYNCNLRRVFSSSTLDPLRLRIPSLPSGSSGYRINAVLHSTALPSSWCRTYRGRRSSAEGGERSGGANPPPPHPTPPRRRVPRDGYVGRLCWPGWRTSDRRALRESSAPAVPIAVEGTATPPP